MSERTSPAAPRLRPTLTRDLTRGAAEGTLDQPAGLFLQEIPWQGHSPDPDELTASSFLRWL